MAADVQVKELAEQRTLSLRDKVARDNVEQALTTLLPQLRDYISEQGLQVKGHPFVRYHSALAVANVKLDVEVGYPLGDGATVEPDAPFSVDQLPGGTAATVRVDHYNAIGDAYEALQQWIEDSEYEAGGAPWEVNRDDPATVDNASELEVDLVWPLRREG